MSSMLSRNPIWHIEVPATWQCGRGFSGTLPLSIEAVLNTRTLLHSMCSVVKGEKIGEEKERWTNDGWQLARQCFMSFGRIALLHKKKRNPQLLMLDNMFDPTCQAPIMSKLMNNCSSQQRALVILWKHLLSVAAPVFTAFFPWDVGRSFIWRFRDGWFTPME